MYPFERFTEPAKKVLILAQEEAETSGHAYVGTEHLGIALFRSEEGIAHECLVNLGVSLEPMRRTVEEVLGRNEGITVRNLIPTSRVKTTIELAFQQAEKEGRDYVGTEHLLLGLLQEGNGVAAHVLTDMGVTEELVRTELQKLHQRYDNLRIPIEGGLAAPGEEHAT